MREIFLSILGVVLVATILLREALFCGSMLPLSASPIASQQEVLRQFVSGPKNCLCEEIRVRYSFKSDTYLISHIAYYNPGQKTLRIETDPGSGWSFGWDNVDTPLIDRVLREGGDFRLFTTYRPDSKHPPYRTQLPY